MSTPAPALVLACGNPSRGDDAFGPRLIETLEVIAADPIRQGKLECRWEYQFQIEHALELPGRRWVVLVDASLVAPAPFEFSPLIASSESGIFSHALSPSALLAVSRRLHGEPDFEAYVLAIRGEEFALGSDLSASGQANLGAALCFLQGWLDQRLASAAPTSRQDPAA